MIAGINATIFAYGQTGSGKTYTMTGGPQRYCDRGLIPRALSRVFAQSANHNGITISISYMEIYNEVRALHSMPMCLVLLEISFANFNA